MKRALITGGAKRLGRAMTLYLAERGLDVAIHYSTSREAAEEVEVTAVVGVVQLGAGAAKRQHGHPVAPHIALGQQQLDRALGLGQPVQG